MHTTVPSINAAAPDARERLCGASRMNTAPLPEGNRLRGISVQQRNATCILTGQKGIENRPRPWSWRGWMLLHAGKRIDRPVLRVPLIARTIRDRELTTGAVPGIARLVDSHHGADGFPPCTPWARAGTWRLVLEAVQELPLPVPADGQSRCSICCPTFGRDPHVRQEAAVRAGTDPGCRRASRMARQPDRPTPMRSYYGEPVHKACAEDSISAEPLRPASAGPLTARRDAPAQLWSPVCRGAFALVPGTAGCRFPVLPFGVPGRLLLPGLCLFLLEVLAHFLRLVPYLFHGMPPVPRVRHRPRTDRRRRRTVSLTHAADSGPSSATTEHALRPGYDYGEEFCVRVELILGRLGKALSASVLEDGPGAR
ncbi:hypothetical protein [Streptomyces sp. NPDC005890]|uniref:hypothetical protein n=1 Tax=Streptomyces sp. NPDC005890 TaxID=3154568 RepID=UPI0033FE5E05